MIDKSKQYRTRDGREVRIYATDGAEPTPVHGAIQSKIDSEWRPYRWYSNGRSSHNPNAFDMDGLIEVRSRHKRTVWLNMYREGQTAHYSKDAANQDCERMSLIRIACIMVELDFEEGQGL